MRTRWSGPVLTTWIRLADRSSRVIRSLAGRFREHWRESVGQVAALEVCLKRLGSDTSTFKDLASRFVGIAQAYAGMVSLDEPGEETGLAAYASMHLEITRRTFRCARRSNGACGAGDRPDVRRASATRAIHGRLARRADYRGDLEFLAALTAHAHWCDAAIALLHRC